MADMVQISVKEYLSLKDDANWRRCLEAGGVTSDWEWYSEALDAGGYYEEEEDEE